MEVPDLVSLMGAGYPLTEFLAIVGTECLDNHDALRRDQYSAMTDLYNRVVAAVAAASRTMWTFDGTFVTGPKQDLNQTLAMISLTPDLATMCVLEGLCRGVAADFFATVSRVVTIERGMVFPLPKRKLEGWQDVTPNPTTPRDQLLDPSCGLVIWNNQWTLELDFTFRDRVEAVCWTDDVDDPDAEPRLPTIASVHPFLGSDMCEKPRVLADHKFFGVCPAGSTTEEQATDAQKVVAALTIVGERAQIAVVPEFTLHAPRALEAHWNGDGTPPIVVSGSAHCEEGGVRANTSVTYLDGASVLEISKYYPFNYRPRTGSDGSTDGARRKTFKEAIAPRERILRVVASTSTRLAVVICSDLNSLEILNALTDAAVNVLLCPAWTPKAGTFPGAVDALASYSQCVSMVANTPGHPDVKAEPFWAITRVPREGTSHVDHWSVDGHRIGLFNPNLPPSDPNYFVWMSP